MPRVTTKADTGGSSKRSSSHHSVKQRELRGNDVHFTAIDLSHEESRALCAKLSQGDRRPRLLPGYPADKVSQALYLAQVHTEPRIQRDVTPWVVPSPEHLFLSEELPHDHIGEEVQTLWDRCEVMGSSVPKPDVTIGLQRSAFTEDEWAKLENCATSASSFLITPNLWFPFLICEVKTDRSGMEGADTQNIHSASIAVRSILRVFIAAYGRDHAKVNDLLSRILVFTVAHDSRRATIHGHFATPKPGTSSDGENFEYHRYEIAGCSLTSFNDAERYTVYNFVRNLYDEFAPDHVKRLKDAIAELPDPTPRTGISFDASNLDVDESSRSNSTMVETEGNVFKIPSESASSMMLREMQELKSQLKEMQELKSQLAEQGKNYMKEIDNLRRESKEREMRLERDSKEREMKLEREKGQIERERKEEMTKLMDVIAELSKARKGS